MRVTNIPVLENIVLGDNELPLHLPLFTEIDEALLLVDVLSSSMLLDL